MSIPLTNLEDILKYGYLRSEFGICCPDCEYSEGKRFYELSNTDNFIDTTFTLMGCEAITGCCFNLYTTQTNYDNLILETGTIPNTEVTVIGTNVLVTTTGDTACSGNDFYSCITSLSGLCDDFNVLVDSGLLEINTLSGKSGICILKDYIVNNSLTTSEAQELLEIFFGTGSIGLIVYCYNNNILMSECKLFGVYYINQITDDGPPCDVPA